MDQYTLLKDMLNLSRSNNMILSVEIIQEGMLGTKKSTICLFFPLPRQTKFFFFFGTRGWMGGVGGVGRGIDMHRGPTLTAAVRNFSPITPTMSPAFPFLGLAGTSGVATMKKP